MDVVQISIPVPSINTATQILRNVGTVGAYTWFVVMMTVFMVCDTPTPPNNIPQEVHIDPTEIPLLFRIVCVVQVAWIGLKICSLCLLALVAASLTWWFWPRGVGMRDLLLGTWYEAYTTSLAARWDRHQTDRDRRLLRLQGKLSTRGIISIMEDGSLADVPNELLAADHIKFATKWALLAKVEFQLPSDTPANRIVVGKWLSEQWKEQHVRLSLRVQALQPAIDLTFVRTPTDATGSDAAQGYKAQPPPPA